MEFVENIEIKVSMSEIKELVKREIESKGYIVESIQIDHVRKQKNVGDIIFGHTEYYSEICGIKATVKRKEV